MVDLKIGIIGLNEGNGHPYSYSAMFNGFDSESLQNDCPFELIREYLPRDHRNENLIDGATVTHIWTQERAISESVSRVAKIPNIVDHYEDMLGSVDAVILARDDPWNHLQFARPFIKVGLPIFIDKQLAESVEDCREILELAKGDFPIMAGSAARYSANIDSTEHLLNDINTLSIHGMSRVSWIRYGHHVLEPIVRLFGYDVSWVRSLSARNGHDIVQLYYSNGMNVILEFIEHVHLPIHFTCFTCEKEPLSFNFDDFNHSFRKMLQI